MESLNYNVISTIIAIFAVILLYNFFYNYNKSIFWILIGILLILLQTSSKYFDITEHLQISGEAVQNIGSIYNSEQLYIKDLTVTNSFNLLPKGSIILWNGSDKNVPTGWILCDGANGTPDMRGRVPIGSGQGTNLSNKIFGEMGGEEQHTLSIAELPQHSHNIPGLTPDRGYANGSWSSFRNVDTGIESSSTGKNIPHNNMQPYIVLNYIMKI